MNRPPILTEIELAYIYDTLARLSEEEASTISDAGGKQMCDEIKTKLDRYFNE